MDSEKVKIINEIKDIKEKIINLDNFLNGNELTEYHKELITAQLYIMNSYLRILNIRANILENEVL